MAFALLKPSGHHNMDIHMKISMMIVSPLRIGLWDPFQMAEIYSLYCKWGWCYWPGIQVLKWSSKLFFTFLSCFFSNRWFFREQTAAGEGFLEASALAQFRKTHHPPRWKVKVPRNRNLQQDPRFTDPEKTWVSNSSIATSFFGVRGDSVPFNFWWKGWSNGIGKSRLVNLEFWVGGIFHPSATPKWPQVQWPCSGSWKGW